MEKRDILYDIFEVTDRIIEYNNIVECHRKQIVDSNNIMAKRRILELGEDIDKDIVHLKNRCTKEFKYENDGETLATINEILGL